MISPHTVASPKNWLLGFLMLLILNLLAASAQAATPKPKLAVTQAAWSAKLNTLTVKGSLKNAAGHAAIEILDTSGRRLGLATGDSFNLSLKGQDLPSIPCAVRVQSGALETLVKVGGAPKSCASPAPTCQIVSPVNGAALHAHQTISFQAQTQQKDKKAGPLKVEWDFAGGVMQPTAQRMSTQPAGSHHTDATFVRDNSRYRVRFIATDSQNRRCEDSVDVAIGNPPTAAELPNIAPLAQAAQQSQPKLGSGLQGNTVVLPFEKRSMQCGHEAELMVPATTGATPPTAYTPQYNSINAYVYKKALRPALLDDNSVQLNYSAASNPAEPAGANAINATSQNWPVGSNYADALLKKGEQWEVNRRPQGTHLMDGYVSLSLIAAMSDYIPGYGLHAPEADEGAYKTGLVNTDHGRYMPGIGNPYAANDPQEFSTFDGDNHWFSALWLPLTNINDSGRVSPTSLFRVQAIDKDSQQPLASIDVSVTAGKDFHCRECHALGKIGANAAVPRVNGRGNSEADLGLVAAASDSIEDQEAAALQNMNSLHMFNDDPMRHNHKNHAIAPDVPSKGCIGAGMCHSDAAPTIDKPEFNIMTGQKFHTGGDGGSNVMHRLHGALQYNADQSDIVRDANGRYVCTGYDKTQCSLDQEKSLFPVKSADGTILPMEDNCLKCHSGQREQCYRDRMYTAGVTCYQCHGDMLAVAQQYPKRQRHPDDNAYRTPWLEQPDCASCHVGSANVGKDGKNGFFSAGIKTLAFAADDPAATPNAVDLTNPDQRRFAVPPTELDHVGYGSGQYNPTLITPLYRLGKDSHGQVACAACHGPAHGIWPNRDPNANDNVTALELQGHTGSLLDCNVCHTPDSFAKFEDLDEGLLVTDAKVGVLGGPHNLHPINDPNWWLKASGDTPNSDGSTSGGWHNNYAQQPGQDNEDQCAACHGNDHKGTRLSKTPVDRVFDFSKAPDWPLLKKAGIKPLVTVKAGTAIGCDTCHGIAMSCTYSPGQYCGKASEHVTGSTNKAPIMAPDHVEMPIGESKTFQLNLFDPEQDAVTIAPVWSDNGFSIDAGGQLNIYGSYLEQAQQMDLNDSRFYRRPPFTHVIPLLLRDDHGAEAIRNLTVSLNCPAGSVFDVNMNGCMPLTIYSIAPTGGLDAGTLWTFPVKAESGTGQPLQYSLLDPVPPGMSIDDQGMISWDTQQIQVNSDQSATAQVQDSDGNSAQLAFTLTICKPPMHWEAQTSSCVGSVHITSTAPANTNANQFSYQVTYSEDHNKQGTFSLIDAPTGFQISPQGLITGTPYLSTLGEAGYLAFRVQVAVAPDNWAQQYIASQVCGGTYRFGGPDNNCYLLGPVQQISPPDYTVSAGQVYHYASTWTNSNGLPMSYSLLGAQPGMSIDGATGVFSWDSTAYTGQTVSFGILAQDGTVDGWGAQKFILNVCPGETPIYDPAQGCIAGPIQFTTTPDIGASYNQVYTYKALTSDANPLPVSYTMSGAPSGSSIDANGLLILNTTGLGDAVDMKQLAFNIFATDTQGAWTQQQVLINLCPQATPNWDANQYQCVQ